MDRYEASGRFGALLLPLLLLATAIGGALAWVYQKLIDVIPFIYLNVLITFGFAVVLVALVTFALTAGKNRSPAIALLAAVAVPLAADAASFWWAYRFSLPDFHEAFEQQARKEGLEIGPLDEFDQHFTFQDWLEARVEIGWTVGRLTSSGPSLSGLLVYLVWLIEAGILVGLSVAALRQQPQAPFCERCGVWQDSEPLAPWRNVDAKALRRAAEDEQLAPLLAPVAQASSGEHGAYVLYDCPSCQTGPFLDVSVSRVEKDAKGKVETKTDVLAKGVALTESQRDALRKYPYVEARRGRGDPAEPS